MMNLTQKNGVPDYKKRAGGLQFVKPVPSLRSMMNFNT